MNDSEGTSSNIVASSIAEIVKTDEVRPIIREGSRFLETLLMMPNAMLDKFRYQMIITRAEQELSLQQFRSGLETRMERISDENLVLPPRQVIADCIEGYMLTNEDEGDAGHHETAKPPSLREMYLNLLAAGMNKSKIGYIRGGFADAIKQMNPDEARILLLFATKLALPLLDVYEKKEHETKERPVLLNHSNIGQLAELVHPEHTQVYIDNLLRLNILAKMPIVEEYYVFSRVTVPGHRDADFQALETDDSVLTSIGYSIDEERKRLEHTSKRFLENARHLDESKREEFSKTIRQQERSDFIRRHDQSLRRYLLVLTPFGKVFCTDCLPFEDDNSEVYESWQTNSDIRDLIANISSRVSREEIKRHQEYLDDETAMNTSSFR